MTPEVQAAVDDLGRAYPKLRVTARDDEQGGAYVLIDDLPLGSPYEQDRTWLGFRITFQHPYSDVYPHFVRGDLSRIDKQPLGIAMSLGQEFEGRQAVQISRVSKSRDPQCDTPLLKAERVLNWLVTRP